MLIAVAVNGTAADAVIPESLEESVRLLVIETDTDTVAAEYAARDDGGLFFAQRTVLHDCEAIVCGTLEKESFEELASHCVTRYYGTGLPAFEAAHAAELNHLPLTTDHVGGHGCGSHEKDRCAEDMEAHPDHE